MTKSDVYRKMDKIAKTLLSMDFPSKESMDEYLKLHPGADKSLHRVVENKSAPKSKNTVNNRLYDVSIPSKTNVTNFTKELLERAKDNDALEYDENGKPVGHEDADMYISDILSNSKRNPRKFMKGVEKSIEDIGDNDYLGLVRMGISALRSPEIKKQFGSYGCKLAASAYLDYALQIIDPNNSTRRQ